MTEEIYKAVKENVTGWMVYPKMEWFEKIYREFLSKSTAEPNPFVVVELGVFYGMSAIAQGLIIKQLGIDCKLYAVDAWSKEACVEGSNSPANNEWWSNLNYEEIYQSFFRSIKNFELEGIVIPIRAKSVDAIQILPKQIDMVHFDGNHSYEIVSKEIELYAPRITGYAITDDEKWIEMQGAAEHILNYGFERIHAHNKDGQSFGVFKKS